MKRRVKKESIVILILSILVITLAILLIVANHRKKDCSCDGTEKNKIENIKSITCGDDNDLSRFVCNRFHMNGYIITFKGTVEEGQMFDVMNNLISETKGMPIMIVNKNEINAVLRNMYGLQEEKDFGIDSFLFVDNQNVKYDDLAAAIKKIDELDHIIEVKVTDVKTNKK